MTKTQITAAASETPELKPEPAPSNPIGLRAIAAMLLLIGATHLASQYMLAGGMPMLLASSLVLGWIAYTQMIEGRMFVRRAVADIGFESGGLMHRILSKGRGTKLIVLVIAVVWSGSFLLHANQMPLYMWGLIYLDAFIIAGLLRLTRRQVTVQSKASAAGLLGRQYVFWLNLAVLTLFICIAGFFMPVADLRGLSLVESFTSAWSPMWQYTANPIVAAWAGMIAGVDAVVWNIMQQISQWDIGAPLKLTAWILFFALFQALYLWLIQSAMLGTLVIAEQAKSWPDRWLGKSRAARWGWGTFYVLIAIWLGLSLSVDSQQQNRTSFPLHITASPAPEKLVIDPCKDIAPEQAAQAAATMDQQMIQEQPDYSAAIDHQIDTQLDAAFAHTLNGVDAYLDWYFTLYGEWQRLAMVVVGDVGDLMQEKMQQLVVDDSGFTTAINAAKTGIADQAAAQLTQSAQRMISVARQQVDIHPCSVDQTIDVALPALSRDLQRIALTTSASIAAGTAIAMTTGAAIATKLAASASAKMAAKLLAKTAVKAAAKTAGGMAGAGAGAFAGLSCGPYAPVCSTALAVAGFFGIDALFIEGDELINRADMRSDMIKTLTAQRDQIKALQKVSYHKAGDTFFSHVSEQSQALFTPIADGL